MVVYSLSYAFVLSTSGGLLRFLTVGFLILGAAACAQDTSAPKQNLVSQPGALKITAIEGEGAINNIRTKSATQLVVEVHDEAGKPVAGAEVVFQLPAAGPGGTGRARHGTPRASVPTRRSAPATRPAWARPCARSRLRDPHRPSRPPASSSPRSRPRPEARRRTGRPRWHISPRPARGFRVGAPARATSGTPLRTSPDEGTCLSVGPRPLGRGPFPCIRDFAG